MSDLLVCYCKRCGYYAYFQLLKNAVCPKCDISLNVLTMTYQDFMNLDYPARDKLLTEKILNSYHTYCEKISKGNHLYNNRQTIALLTNQISDLQDANNELSTANSELTKLNTELTEENATLEHDVHWMHDMIWDLVRKNRKMTADLRKYAPDLQVDSYADEVFKRIDAKIAAAKENSSPSSAIENEAATTPSTT